MTIPWLVGQFFEVVGLLITTALVFACVLAELLAFLAVLSIGVQKAPAKRQPASLIGSDRG